VADHHVDRNVAQQSLHVTVGRATRVTVKHTVIINGGHASLTVADDMSSMYGGFGVIGNDELGVLLALDIICFR
jgi:hypothetical protein